VHTADNAGYGWDVVRTAWAGEAFRLADDPLVLPLAGWLQERRARALLAAGGLDLDDLRRRSERPDFAPVEVPVEVSVTVARSTRSVEGANVVGVLPGRSPMAVLLSAHFDHFGIAREVDGDAIYNGAVDNGTALATLLALAQAHGRTPRESRPTLVFAAVDAEEEGLLGSAAYTRRPAVPLPDTLAAINFEMSNAWGRTRDVLAIGAEHSSLGQLLAAVLARAGLHLATDPVPEQGYFFRSDQYAFAQAGVPAIWVDGGTDYEGRPPGWGDRVRRAYRESDYHRPSDEVKPEFDLAGLAQLAEVTSALIAEIAARGRVDWRPTSAEFSGPGCLTQPASVAGAFSPLAASRDLDILCDFVADERPVKQVLVVRGERVVVVVGQRHVSVDRARDLDHFVPVAQRSLQVFDSRELVLFAALQTVGLQRHRALELLRQVQPEVRPRSDVRHFACRQAFPGRFDAFHQAQCLSIVALERVGQGGGRDAPGGE
jgi:hypothetical protein